MLAREEWNAELPEEPAGLDVYGCCEAVLKQLTLAAFLMLVTIGSAATLAL